MLFLLFAAFYHMRTDELQAEPPTTLVVQPLSTATITFETLCPDYCDDGPVTIVVQTPRTCEDVCSCAPSGNRESGYREICWCDAVACFATHEERWTDYPECGGKKIEREKRDEIRMDR